MEKLSGSTDARAIARRQSRTRRCVIGLLFPSLMSSPDDLDRSASPAKPAASAVRSCGKGRKSHAKWRWDRLREPGNRAARARSEADRRTARGKIIFERRTGGEPGFRRKVNCRSNAWRESHKRRSRRDIGAAGGGASENAAKTVMTGRISAGGSRIRPVQCTTDAAREVESGSRHGCRKEAL